MRRAALCGAVLAQLATPALAQTDFSDLTPTERAVLHEALRIALVDLQHLLPNAPPPSPLQDEIKTDLARIEAHAKTLFDPKNTRFGDPDAPLPVGLFISKNCGITCESALSDLRQLALTHAIRVTVFDIADVPEMAHALEIDTTPFLVFPDRFYRGHIPKIVLEGHISR